MHRPRALTAHLICLFLCTPALAQLIPTDPTVEQVATGFSFTEGPAVDPNGAIYFTDTGTKTIHRYDPVESKITAFRENSGGANGLMFDSLGRLLACEFKNRRLSRTEIDGTLTTLVDHWQDKKLNSPNDLAIDALGGVYFTDPSYRKRDDLELDSEDVYYLTPDGELTRVIDDLVRPNGIILSPDEKTLYVADEGGKQIFAYDINIPDSPGSPTNARRFSDMGPGLGGGCDGMTTDAAGRLYATGDEGVYIFNPDGSQADLIPTPERPSNCTFANDGKTLYITARTSLYRITLNTVADR